MSVEIAVTVVLEDLWGHVETSAFLESVVSMGVMVLQDLLVNLGPPGSLEILVTVDPQALRANVVMLVNQVSQLAE